MSEQLKPLEEIGDDWFVNRHDELELYWQWATNIPKRVKGSYALIGLRRTGKTAILRRLFNRLFNEQEHVLPVYISFARYLRRPKPIDAYQFAEEYFTGLLRSYLAFRYRAPELLTWNREYRELLEFAQEKADALALDWFRSYESGLAHRHERTRAHSLMQWVINFPKGYARTHNLPMAIIVDEFQVLTRVFNPDDGQIRNLTDSFQEAAETRWAPLLVAGSSVAMMVDEALTGLVSGRFRSTHLGPLTQEFAYEMIFRLGQYNHITITEELALAIWELTQGYPYPIQCLLNSGAPDVRNLPSLDALPKILLYELTNKGGALFEHYDGEYGKYIRELNGEGVSRRILLWSLQQPADQLIFPDRVAEALQLPLTTVMDTLGKLQRTDVLQRRGMGSY